MKAVKPVQVNSVRPSAYQSLVNNRVRVIGKDLRELHLYSLQWRRELYTLLYIWKMLEGLLPILGCRPLAIHETDDFSVWEEQTGHPERWKPSFTIVTLSTALPLEPDPVGTNEPNKHRFKWHRQTARQVTSPGSTACARIQHLYPQDPEGAAWWQRRTT